MSRPSKYNPIRAGCILQALRDGLSPCAAAGRAGIDPEQLTRWRKRFADFAENCDLAEAEAEARFTEVFALAAFPHQVVETKVVKGPEGTIITTTTREEFDWRAADRWLSKRRREDWGERIVHDLDREIAGLMEKLAGSGEDQTPGQAS